MIHLMPPTVMGLGMDGRLVRSGSSPTLAQASADFSLSSFINNLGSFLPTLLGAILVLVFGLILAYVVAWAIKGLLSKTGVDERIDSLVNSGSSSNINVAKWISDGVFWLIALLAVIGFLNALDLTVVSEPLSRLVTTVLEYLPRLFSAGILLVVAWAIATVVKTLVNKALEGFNLDDRLAENTGVDPRENAVQIHETLGNALYWFVFLLFLPPILDALDLQGLLEPVQGLLDQFLSAIPQILTAGLVFAAAWLVAKIARGVVTNLLSATGIDNASDRLGLSQSTPGSRGLQLSSLAGTIVYAVILITGSIAALEKLNIAAISEPAISMLNQISDFIPLLLTAGVVLVVAYFIGKFVGNLVTSLLSGMGFDNVIDALGLPDIPTAAPPADYSAEAGSTMIQPPADHGKSPSEIVGLIVLVGIMLFGAVTATEILQLEQLTVIVSAVMGIAAQVLVGVVIFAIGLYLANLVYRLIQSSNSGSSNLLAQTARIAILAFVGALALGQMGVATNIVNLAFGLLLGAVAVAIAIAFGLGGRDVAAEELRGWLKELKK
ncbi:MAG: mechanosensitive ion channel [Cyanobacteria bacterium J06598_3]